MKSLFSDPLVLAQYDEDTVDKDGTKHKKGDFKLNSEGTYYYETLGGRSPIGKQVLSSLDTLTVDGTKLNKYDFFDSDDIEKSVGGVIAKNVATLIPMFVGGPIGIIYSTALIAREMAKSLPMLYGMTTALFSDSETPKWMNTIAAMGDKFTSGTSDYAKELKAKIKENQDKAKKFINDIIIELELGAKKTDLEVLLNNITF